MLVFDSRTKKYNNVQQRRVYEKMKLNETELLFFIFVYKILFTP